MRRWLGLSLAATLVLGAGCSDLGGLATRYRAERMLWQAKREESRFRVGKARPDSTTLLKIRDGYSRLRATFKPPFVKGESETSKRLNREIMRQVGLAELTGAGLALQARRPDLALEQARWVSSIAAADTSLSREADFMIVAALRSNRKFEDAIEVLRSMLDRYKPLSPTSYDRVDPILTIPETIISIREQTGDSLGARREWGRAVEYFRGVLKTDPPPILEAQVRARITRAVIELGDPNAGYAEVSALRKLVSTTPVLKPVEPEVLYSEARIRGLGKDRDAAIQLYDLVVMMYPDTPFASKALFDAAVILEQQKDLNGALARYRAVYDRAKPNPDVAPIARFRSAMVKEQLGNWIEAKQMLGEIPLAYPESRGALEAPFAIVRHYARTGQADAMKGALLSAVDIYRGLIARDTTSAYCSGYRWNILRAYVGLERWNDALASVDEIAVKDRGTRVAAEALVKGALIATTLKDQARSDFYWQQLALDYPKTPIGESAREVLKRRGLPQGGGKPGK